MAANLDLFRMHLHREQNANTKLASRSPIVDHDKPKVPKQQSKYFFYQLELTLAFSPLIIQLISCFFS